MTNNKEYTGIYIHIPYCKKKCGYCSFYSITDFSSMQLYVSSLKNEIKKRGNKSIICDTVYIGGGTPSTLYIGAITQILTQIRGSFTLLESSEITVECNPESITKEFIKECAGSGVNRISIGLQSSHEKHLKMLSRPHTYGDFIKAVELVKAENITNISADLILGIPNQTENELLADINKLAELKLPHISLYALSLENNVPMHGYIIDEDNAAKLYETAYNRLKELKYNRYEVSNFSKTQKTESSHNNKYWSLSPYIGIGAAAHSYFDGYRTENTSNISKYLLGNHESARTKLSRADLIEEYIMLSLRTDKGINLNYLKTNLNHDLQKEKQNKIQRLISSNLITLNNETIKLTESAYYIMNQIILELI